MGDRLGAILEQTKALSGEIQGPHDTAVQDILLLIHEELKMLRDYHAYAKNAAEEFARRLP